MYFIMFRIFDKIFTLIENFPKTLLKIGGNPLLDYILEEVDTIEKVNEIYKKIDNI